NESGAVTVTRGQPGIARPSEPGIGAAQRCNSSATAQPFQFVIRLRKDQRKSDRTGLLVVRRVGRRTGGRPAEAGHYMQMETALELRQLEPPSGVARPISYSCRSVVIGSTLAARLAGIHAANRQATTITRRLERYATGSVTRTIAEII